MSARAPTGVRDRHATASATSRSSRRRRCSTTTWRARRAALLKQTEVLGGYDPARYRDRARARDGRRTARASRSRSCAARTRRATASSPAAARRLRRLRHLATRSIFSSNAPEPARPRRGLRHRAHPRRRRARQALARRRAACCASATRSPTSSPPPSSSSRAATRAPDRLVIEGGSAGGLLMGAVLNLRPDLFRAAVLRVPFVDVINTMLDESLPLTVGEFEEWGNPKIREQYEYMKTYCPYTNLEREGLSRHAGPDLAQRQPGDVLGARQVRGQAAHAQDRRAPAALHDQPRRAGTAAPRAATTTCARSRSTTRSS